MCPTEIPFAAEAVAGNHSTLTGVLAGFALAAVILTLELNPPEDKSGADTRALFGFVAFVVGALAAFMYSASTGDTGCVAYLGFTLHGGLFVMEAIFLLVALGLLFEAHQRNLTRGAALVAYIVIGFSLVQYWIDLLTTGVEYGVSSSSVWLIVGAITAVAGAAAMTTLARLRLMPSRFATMVDRIVTASTGRPVGLAIASVVVAFLIAFGNGVIIRGDAAEFPVPLVLAYVVTTGAIAGWASVFIPIRRKTMSSSSDG